MALTKLSSILNTINRYQKIYNVEEGLKVLDLDEAIRTIRRQTALPWTLKRTKLKLFDGIKVYPIPDDYGELAYIDTLGKAERANFRFTSLQEFYSDQSNRNQLAEISDNGIKYLGVDFKDFVYPSTLLVEQSYKCEGSCKSAEVDKNFYYQDDPVNDSSLKLDLEEGIATLSADFELFYNPEYKGQCFFIYLFLPAKLNGLTIKLYGPNKDKGHLFKNIDKQFTGAPLKVNDWNIIGIDPNQMNLYGKVDGQFSSYEINLGVMESGYYHIDMPSFKKWQLLDYWYYSKFLIQSEEANKPDKEFFYNHETGTYNVNDCLLGDSEWVDIISYDAILSALTDLEDDRLANMIKHKRDVSWELLAKEYPSLKPSIVTSRYNF